MKLIVGLGNPGKEYKNTRHNVGYMYLDCVAKEKGLTFEKEKFNSKYTEYNYNSKRYLNLVDSHYEINQKNLLIWYLRNFFGHLY